MYLSPPGKTHGNLWFSAFGRAVLVGALAWSGAALPALGQAGGLEAAVNPAQDSASLRGLLNLDGGSGAAGLNIPLGPGIGSARLRYDPVLTGRFAPLVGMAPLLNAPGAGAHAPALLATTAFALSPGTLDWELAGGPVVHALIRWTFPDGSQGSLDGALPVGSDPSAILARFGYAPGPNDGRSAPVAGSASPHNRVATGGTLLFSLEDPVHCAPQGWAGGGESGKDAEAMAPAAFLVVQGGLAYEFSKPERARGHAGLIGTPVHYRLTAIRDSEGEAVTFTYGPNGVDYEARWGTQSVRVTLDGVAPIPPLLAMDDAFSPLHPEAPSLAFRDAVARIRVVYEGTGAPVAYAIIALARPEFHTPDGTFTGDFRVAGTTGVCPSDAFRRNLQVTTVRKAGTGEYLRFGYGKAPGCFQGGADGSDAFAPTVLQEIGLQGHTLRLGWEGRPESGPGSSTSWRYGVCFVEDQDLAGTSGSVTTHKLTLNGAASSSRFTDTIVFPDGSVQTLAGPGHLPALPWCRVSERGLTFSLLARSGTQASPSHAPVPLRPRPRLMGGMDPGGWNGTPFRPQPPTLPELAIPGWPRPTEPTPPPFAPGPPLQPQLPPPPSIPGWPILAPGEPMPGGLPGLPNYFPQRGQPTPLLPPVLPFAQPSPMAPSSQPNNMGMQPFPQAGPSPILNPGNSSRSLAMAISKGGGGQAIAQMRNQSMPNNNPLGVRVQGHQEACSTPSALVNWAGITATASELFGNALRISNLTRTSVLVGNSLTGLGAGIEAYQVYKGDVEVGAFLVNTAVSGIGIVGGPAGAALAVAWYLADPMTVTPGGKKPGEGDQPLYLNGKKYVRCY